MRVQTADLVAVGLAAWWLRGMLTRRKLRARFLALQARAPVQAEVLKRTWPKVAAYVDTAFAEPMTIPVVLVAYVAVRKRK